MGQSAASAFSTRENCAPYEGLVVKKPWGAEYLIFHNLSVAGWILHIDKGSQTSLHCHPNKKSSLVVLKGRGFFRTHDGARRIKEGEGVVIGKGVFHSTKAASANGMIVLEIESPPNKKDLYRFDDVYGRASCSYEGEESYVSMGQSEYVGTPTFYDFKDNFGVEKEIGNYVLSIHRYGHVKRASRKKYVSPDILVGVLAGDPLTPKGNSDIEPATITRIGDFREAAEKNFSDDGELLLIRKK